MSFTRQRSDRPDPARRRQVHTPELLESRQLLSGTLPSYLAPYTPSDLYVTNPITNQRIPTSIRSLVQHNNPNSPLLSNQGKIVSGTDRQGNQWTITVHGPGQVIVTDTTPNDGSLDDEINTIQIIGSNPRTTYVTGTTVASNTVLSSGTVNFNRLIALNGVKSIALNGFNLTHDVTPAVTQSAGIFLYGGVGTLRFNDILALIDTTGTNVTNPYEIVIGDPSTPLTAKPSIYLDSIYNSVFDGTVAPTTANAAARRAADDSQRDLQYQRGRSEFLGRLRDSVRGSSQLCDRQPGRNGQRLDRSRDARRAALGTGSGGLPVLLQRGGNDGPHLAAGAGDQPSQCQGQVDEPYRPARPDPIHVEPERPEIPAQRQVRRQRRWRGAGCERDRSARSSSSVGWATRPARSPAPAPFPTRARACPSGTS